MAGIMDSIDDITIGPSKAAKIANVSRQTIYNWYYQHGIGRIVAGKIRIYPDRLNKLLREDDLISTKKKVKDEVKKKSYICPFNYFFGRDYDEKPKCRFCNNIVWLHCGNKHDQYEAISQYKNKKKTYNSRELEKKIKEMEERL